MIFRASRSRVILLVTLLFGFAGSCGPALPRLELTAPAHGSFHTAGSINVVGRVYNVPPANAQVTVNGVVASVDASSNFSHPVTLDPAEVFNAFLVELTDLRNGKKDRERVTVIAGDSVADGSYSLQSVAMRLRDSGLDALEPMVESLAGGSLDLSTLLTVGTVLVNNQCVVDGGFLGCLGRATVSIVNPPPSNGDFALAVDSQTNLVASTIDVFDVEVNIHIEGTGLVPNCDYRLTSSRVDVDGNYTLQPDAGDPSTMDVNQSGGLATALQNFSQTVTGGTCDIPIIGDIVQLFIGSLEDDVTAGLKSFLEDPDGAGPADGPVGDGIEAALAGISITGPIGETLGLQLDTPMFDVLEDADGITIGTDARVTSVVGTGPGECEPPAGAPDLLASYHLPELFPSFGATTPVNGFPYELGLCLSTSAFNQLLKAGTECGLLRSTITEADLGAGLVPITAGFLSFLIPELGAIDPTTPLRVELKPTLAPIITSNPGPGGELVELRLGHLEIELANLNNSFVHLVAASDVRLGLDLTIDPNTGELAPVISQPNQADIDVALLRNNIGTNPASVESFLPFVLGPLIPSLADNLGSFPLPSFLGLQLGIVEVSREGQFLSLFSDFVTVP